MLHIIIKKQIEIFKSFEESSHILSTFIFFNRFKCNESFFKNNPIYDIWILLGLN